MHYILKIFDLISRNKYAGGLSLIAITHLLLCLALRINLNEDITAFLPLNEQQQKALAVYQDTSGANKILAIFQNNAPACKDYDAILLAIEKFKDTLQQKDTAHIVHNLVTEFNTEEITQMTDFVYSNIPYFLTSSDYQRIDSLLSSKDFISRQIQEDKAMLQMAISGPVADHLAIDPLNLFQPVLARLKQHTHSKVEIYQGAIFTPDMSRAIVMMDSPFGNNETKNNTRLMNLLQSVADTVQLSTTNVNIHFIGGPSIAVENAKQIKADSTLAAVIAIALIVLLLYIHLRSTRNILLILLSVAWGSLFAIAALAVLSQRPSLIVIGISSIIIGLAVNYPLHLIAHTAHTHTQRQALREVITPLVIGNITTVGAFIALLPLQATALRDLGIFSAFLLVGTLIFTIIFLPHLIKKHAPSIPPPAYEDSASDKITLPSPETSALPTTVSNNKKIIALLLILTPIFAYYSTLTGFDADISHINYMTDQQKADIQAFQNITSNNPTNNNAIYIVAEGKTIQQALNLNQKNINNLTTSAATPQCALTTLQFLPSKRQQQQRIQKWQAFIKKNSHKLIHQLNTISTQNGFSPDAFNQFHNILTSTYPIKEYTYFSPLTLINNPFLSIDTINKSYRVITYLHTTATVPEESASNKTISRNRDCPPPHLDTPAAWNIDQTINSTPTKPKDNTFAFHVKSLSSAATRALSDNFNYIGYVCALIVFLFLTLSFQSIELALISFLPMAISWIWILGIMGIANIQFNIVNIILATFIFGQGDDYTIFITEGCTYEYAYHKKMIDSYKKSIIISATIMFIGIGTLIIAKHPALQSLATLTIIGMATVVLFAFLIPPIMFQYITTSNAQPRLRPLTLNTLLRTLIYKTLPFPLFLHIFSNPNNILSRILNIRIIIDNPQNISTQNINIIYPNKQSHLTNKLINTLFPNSIPTPSHAHTDITPTPSISPLPSIVIIIDTIMPPDTHYIHQGTLALHITHQQSPSHASQAFASDKTTVPPSTSSVLTTHMYDFIPLIIDQYRYKGAHILRTVKRNLRQIQNISNIAAHTQQNTLHINDNSYGEIPLLIAITHPHLHIFVHQKDLEKRTIATYAAQRIAPNIQFIE